MATRFQACARSVASFAASAWLLITACCAGTDSIATESSAEERPKTVACAATVEEMNGRDCAGELACGFKVECGSFAQHARCECKAGRIACADPLGTLAVHDSPRCAEMPGTGEDAEPCPATMAAAAGTACSVTEMLCFYRGDMCASGVANFNYCACSPVDGGWAYVCAVIPCPPAE